MAPTRKLMSAYTMPSTTLTTVLDDPPQIGDEIQVAELTMCVDQVTPSELYPGCWDVTGRLVLGE